MVTVSPVSRAQPVRAERGIRHSKSVQTIFVKRCFIMMYRQPLGLCLFYDYPFCSFSRASICLSAVLTAYLSSFIAGQSCALVRVEVTTGFPFASKV